MHRFLVIVEMFWMCVMQLDIEGNGTKYNVVHCDAGSRHWSFSRFRIRNIRLSNRS